MFVISEGCPAEELLWWQKTIHTIHESDRFIYHTRRQVSATSVVWWWAGCVSSGQKNFPLSGPLPHLLIKRTLVCGRAQQTGKGIESKAMALRGAVTGIYLNFSHRDKLGEIHLTSTFDQMYVQRIRLCTTFCVYTGLVLRPLALRKRPC